MNVLFLGSALATAEIVWSVSVFIGPGGPPLREAFSMDSLGVFSIAALVAAMAYFRAIRAAQQWGDWVKAAFDLYLPTLAASMEIPAKEADDRARSAWNLFSRAVIYRNPDRLREIANLRVSTPDETRVLKSRLRKLEADNEILYALLETKRNAASK